MAKIASKKSQNKIECLNPNTGGKLKIDAEIYQVFTAAIKQTLKGGKEITFTDLVEGIKKYLKSKKITFKKSVPWYAVTIKNDLEVRKIIESFTLKGKKFHKLKTK